MIKRTRKSFIKITMTMLTLMLIIPMTALNIITAALTYNSNKQLLEQIAQTEVYILSPQMKKFDDPPPNENFLGIGKQQHTTSTVVTTTTTTYDTVSETTDTNTVKTQIPYNNDKNQSTAPIKPKNTDIQTTVPKEPDTPPYSDNTDFEPPIPPDFGEWTRPPEHDPDIKRTRPPRPEFWDPPPNNDPWGGNEYGNFGAVLISPISIKIKNILAANASNNMKTTTTTTTTVTSAATTDLTDDSKFFDSDHNLQMTESKPRVITKKQFKKDILGHKPPDINSSNNIDHFIVYLDKKGVVTDVHGNDDYSIETCTELIENINKNSKLDGYYNSLQYVKRNYAGGSIVVFSDRQSDIEMMKILFFASMGVFVLMEGIVFILTKILTQRAMRPMQISYEKQQQFISDAGHELKTPLTVISANADILFDEIGENKWLSYIKSQTERMRILVQEMLDLTKLSYSNDNIPKSKFNISSLIENVALPFECQAFEQKKTFHIELEPEVEFIGNTERIRRMVGIFIDNAFKYSNENGTVKIQLKTENGKKILKIYNTGIGIAKGEEEKIFERFYRSDSSRSNQGGYGLGLAIAKSIADQHDIKIQVQTEPSQWISFNLTL